MEQLGQITRAQQSVGSSAVALGTARSLSVESLRQLGLMLQQMSAAFPHQEVAPETAEIFFVTFEDLALEFGMPNLETAMRWFLSRQIFSPHPSEVRGVLEEMARKAKAAIQENLPKIGCERCKDSEFAPGYIMVQNPGQERFVQACVCRLARNRAKKALEAKA